jgi:DNA-directed RNA polymerase subunit F
VGLVIQAVAAVLELLEHLAKAELELQLVAEELVGHRAQVSHTREEQENSRVEQLRQMAAAAVAAYWQLVQIQPQRPEQPGVKAAAVAEQDITRQPEQLAALAQF